MGHQTHQCQQIRGQSRMIMIKRGHSVISIHASTFVPTSIKPVGNSCHEVMIYLSPVVNFPHFLLIWGAEPKESQTLSTINRSSALILTCLSSPDASTYFSATWLRRREVRGATALRGGAGRRGSRACDDYHPRPDHPEMKWQSCRD